MTTTMGRLVAGVAMAGMVGAYAGSRPAQAASATANLSVSASVVAQCTIQAPNTLAFGNYDPVTANASTNLDAATTISVACTKNAPSVTVGLGLGANASGSTRRMANGTERLTYEIYSDSGRSSVWGNTIGTNTVSYTAASKATASLDVFGRVPSGQDVGAGNYSDTVVATINF